MRLPREHVSSTEASQMYREVCYVSVLTDQSVEFVEDVLAARYLNIRKLSCLPLLSISYTRYQNLQDKVC